MKRTVNIRSLEVAERAREKIQDIRTYELNQLAAGLNYYYPYFTQTLEPVRDHIEDTIYAQTPQPQKGTQ
jgi:hypothetical protein